MHRTTSHLHPSDIPAAGYQRDGKGEKAACSPLCHVPKVNIQQDRTHGFASLFYPLTLHPAAVQRTGNASWLLTSVSLTFYPMMDSAAEVSKYSPAYLTLSFHPPAVNEAEEDETSSRLSSTIVPPVVVNEAEGDVTSSRLSSTIVPPDGSQRSGRGRNKLPSIPHYRSTRGSQRSGRGRNKLPSIPHYRSTRR